MAGTRTLVKGTVLRTYAPVKRGKYQIYDFVLKTGDGDIKVAKFGEGVDDLIGENVSFDANYNEEYDKYTVVGNITSLDSTPVEPSAPVESSAVEEPEVKPKRRGRPRKNVTPKETTRAVNENLNHDFQQACFDAYTVVGNHVEAARNLLGGEASDTAVATLVQAISSTAATLFINSQKDRRVADMKKGK